MNTLYNYEQFKVIIKFSSVVSGLPDYVVKTGSPIKPATASLGKHVSSIDIDFNDGNRSDNPLGTMSSSYGYINIYDDEDKLNPLNTESDYYGYCIPGVEVLVKKLVKEIQTVDNVLTPVEVEYPYFTGYVKRWNASYSNGINGYVSLSVEDKLNKVGLFNLDTAEDDYTGDDAADAIAYIFGQQGIEEGTGYIIDTEVGTALTATAYDSLLSGKARNTLNDICNKTLTYLTVEQDGLIHVKKLIPDPVSSGSEDITLYPSNVGSIKLQHTTAIKYNKVVVIYPSQYYMTKVGSSLHNTIGENGFVVIKFTNKVYSIEDVSVDVRPATGNTIPDGNINVLYNGSANNVRVNIINTTGATLIADVNVYGLVPGGNETKSTQPVEIAGGATVEDEIFTYESSMRMNDTVATDLAEDIAEYIKSLRQTITIDTSMLSPDIEVGTVVRIAQLNNTYNGMYRVSRMHITVGESYNVSLTLLKIEEEET